MLKPFLAALLLNMISTNASFSEEPLKIGVMATLKGKATVLGEDTLRGVKTAISQFDGKIAGRAIELVISSTDTSAKSAAQAARDLVENQKVEIVIGPFSSQQGLIIRDYSKTQPQATFLNGISGAPQVTNFKPSKNFFRFTSDNAQWSAGLGEYVFTQKGYKRVAVISDDYAFNHAQVFGFLAEYCTAGGKVESRQWLSSDRKDYTSVIDNIPDDVDALYLGLGGSDALKFIKQYKKTGGQAKYIGSSVTVDGALLNADDKLKPEIIGMPSAGPQAETWGDPGWQKYVKAYQASTSSDQRFKTPSILATGYYNSTTAALVCLDQTKADLSDNHEKLRACLSTIELTLPTGKVKLDENRQAIANNFVSEIVEQDDGTLVKKLIKIKKAINQTLGMNNQDYLELGSPNKNNPSCNYPN